MDILSKIKQAGLVGRGGAGFPTWRKWQAVKNAPGAKKYVVCNGSEGEPGLTKDGYILEHHAERMIDGMKIAIDFLSLDVSRGRVLNSAKRAAAVKGCLFLNYAYDKKLSRRLAPFLKSSSIEIFIKPLDSGYIGGEESAILNAIEGKRIEPRLKPPFPTTAGLWGCPTLISNVETFYDVSLVVAEQYKNNRFYAIAGDCPNEGVYELPADFTVEKILKETKNYPRFPFFVQSGGKAAGEVFNSRQLKRPVSGAGAITVYSLAKNNYVRLIRNWLDFFADESCGQCTPCREGTLRLQEIFRAERTNWVLFNDLLDNLADTSLCALGSSVAVPIKSFIKNVLSEMKRK
jgi:NADH:ubiquinone oxidoreductase subunit F (NADH-binding)